MLKHEGKENAQLLSPSKSVSQRVRKEGKHYISRLLLHFRDVGCVFHGK